MKAGKVRPEHWGVVALWPAEETCINILGQQAMVQVVEKLDETIDPGRPHGPESPLVIG